MKRLVYISAVLAGILLASCDRIEKGNYTEGTLSFEQFDLVQDSDVVTKAGFSAPGSYSIFITDKSGGVVLQSTYSQIKGSTVTLPVGKYTLEARSTSDDVPTAAFETPVYGTSADFSIEAGKTTRLSGLTCTLLQVKVTVSYDDSFLEMVTGNGTATVCVDPSAPLAFQMNYDNGNVTYDQSAGYFTVNNGNNTTMNIVYSGNLEGKSQKMVANLTGIEPRQWRQVRFVKKVDSQGNATFVVEIDDYVSDAELQVAMAASPEAVIGEDPDAPKGDGGIDIAFAQGSTMFSDLSNIVVPDISVPMDLRLDVTVPGGVRKVAVEIASTSSAFIEAVALAGGTTLDLINPTPEQDIIFQIVPFPHGNDLFGQTSLIFDLGAAQEPLLAFPGVHTFKLKITDTNGCYKEVPVVLVVS